MTEDNNNASNINDEILKLNVGGEHFITTRTTLCAVEGSMLAALFALDSKFLPPPKIGAEIFLDRNPITFGRILDYLRDGCRLVVNLPKDNVSFLERLRADADYFGLTDLVTLCEEAEVESLVLQKKKEEEKTKTKKKRYEYIRRQSLLSRRPDVNNCNISCDDHTFRLAKYIPISENGTEICIFEREYLEEVQEADTS